MTVWKQRRRPPTLSHPLPLPTPPQAPPAALCSPDSLAHGPPGRGSCGRHGTTPLCTHASTIYASALAPAPAPAPAAPMSLLAKTPSDPPYWLGLTFGRTNVRDSRRQSWGASTLGVPLSNSTCRDCGGGEGRSTTLGSVTVRLWGGAAAADKWGEVAPGVGSRPGLGQCEFEPPLPHLRVCAKGRKEAGQGRAAWADSPHRAPQRASQGGTLAGSSAGCPSALSPARHQMCPLVMCAAIISHSAPSRGAAMASPAQLSLQLMQCAPSLRSSGPI